MNKFVLLGITLVTVVLFQNCDQKNESNENPIQFSSLDNLPSLKEKTSSAISVTQVSEPQLFGKKDACALAAKTRPSATANFKKINVKNYGAFGDGKSRKIRQMISDGETLSASLQYSISRVLNAMGGISAKQFKATLNAEADWVAIQAALLDSKQNGHGWVIIPPSSGDYIVDRGLAVGSNTVLEWTGNNFVRITEPSERGTGSVISNFFSYNKDSAPNYDDESCFIRIVNPRIDAGGKNGVPGENGIGFANGVQDVIIVGGHIKNARFGTPNDVADFAMKNPKIDCSVEPEPFAPRCPSLQGGRGIQMESGVKNILVRHVFVSDSTIGFSAAAGLGAENTTGVFNEDRAEFRANRVRNISWNIRHENIQVLNVDQPVLFTNFLSFAGGGKLKDLPATLFFVKGLKARESGWLNTKVGLSVGESDARLGYKASIIGSFGARNVSVEDVHVLNSSSKIIGAFFRGFAHNLKIKDVELNAQTQNIALFDGKVLNVGYDKFENSDIIFQNINQRQASTYAIAGSSVKNLSFEGTLTEISGAIVTPRLSKFLLPESRSIAPLRSPSSNGPVSLKFGP